jgi:hypothetical protein
MPCINSFTITAIMYDLKGREIGRGSHTKGASNDSGWCLSTDGEDAKGGWKKFAFKGVCRSHWDFNI